MLLFSKQKTILKQAITKYLRKLLLKTAGKQPEVVLMASNRVSIKKRFCDIFLSPI